MLKTFPRLFFYTVLLLSVAAVLDCSTAEEHVEILVAGPGAESYGGVVSLNGLIDDSLTNTCGSVAPESDSTTSTSSTTESSTSSDSADETRFDITTYLRIEDDAVQEGGTIFTTFLYDEAEDTFQLNPTTSSISTCPTTDFINCNGTDGVNPTCETVDSVTCGGSNSFVFTSTSPAITFQATSGTIDYDERFLLSSDQGSVEIAELSFDMVATDGTILQGNLTCYSTR